MGTRGLPDMHTPSPRARGRGCTYQADTKYPAPADTYPAAADINMNCTMVDGLFSLLSRGVGSCSEPMCYNHQVKCDCDDKNH